MADRENVNSKTKHRDFLNNETIYVLGKPIRITHISHNRKRMKVELKANQLNIHIPAGYDVKLNREKLKNIIIKWYKEFALEIIHTRLPHYTSKLNLFPSEVKVRSYKSRWGACREDGKIIFNWRLFQAPLEIVDYVIIHELCHLKFMNHSKQYWNLVTSVYPNHKESIKWLKENVLQLKFE